MPVISVLLNKDKHTYDKMLIEYICSKSIISFWNSRYFCLFGTQYLEDTIPLHVLAVLCLLKKQTGSLILCLKLKLANESVLKMRYVYEKAFTIHDPILRATRI